MLSIPSTTKNNIDHMANNSFPAYRFLLASTCAAVTLALTACAVTQQSEGVARKEVIYAVTASNQLINFNAGQPGKILSRKALQGLQDKETVVGIDYRVVRGQLYALSSRGQLYRIDTGNATVQAIGTPVTLPLTATEFGFDFNPTVDRIRVVTNSGQNMRLHPDTGAVVDSDPNTPGVQIDGKLAYAAADVHAGQTPSVVAAGYTYNKKDEKVTTNFALDNVHRTLVTQGSREGTTPPVSPNTGQLYTVGALGIDGFERAAFDISDLSNAAFIAITKAGAKTSSWYEVSLDTGKASLIGSIGTSEPVVGMAIEP